MLPKLTVDDVVAVLKLQLDEINYPLDTDKIRGSSIGRFLDQLEEAEPSDDWHAPLNVFVLQLTNKFLKRGWEILDLDADWLNGQKDEKFQVLIDFIIKHSVYVW